MALIKGTRIVDDPWTVAADADDLGRLGPLIVSYELWEENRAALAKRPGPLGIRLRSDQAADAVAGDLARFALIALEFPTFRDGRGYSTARILRERHGFRGELRAVGNILRDQALFLWRCGFDAFEVAKPDDAAAWAEALAEIADIYQPAASGGPTVRRLRAAVARSEGLLRRYGASPAEDLVRAMIRDEFPGRVAVVAAFGAETAVLLDLVAQVDRTTPVLFLETGKHFAETLAYRDSLAAHFGLTDVRSIAPDGAALAAEDPSGDLWSRDADRCCHLRKVAPLAQALSGFDAWITGRKRYHGDERERLLAIEAADGRVKINPLWDWQHDDVRAAFEDRRLPDHPLVAEGYPSIGCAPCTVRPHAPEAVRSGRWTHSTKTECGIHSAHGAGR